MGSRAPALTGVAAALLAVSTASAATSTPNDPLFTQHDQWALTGASVSINAPAAWCAATGAGVLIADIDTGADFSHQDLQGKLVAGEAFLGGTGAPSGSGVGAVTDDFGHGTMTTGIMVASTDNGLGIAAVAPDARALVVKVLNSQGQGNANDVAAGINYAVAAGAKVINLSLGPDVPIPQSSTTDPISAAIQSAYTNGVAVALAAGNDGIDVSPQALTQLNGYALVVGATGPDGSIASYSNSSLGVNIYAPGGDTSGAETVQNSIVSTAYRDGSGNPTDGYAIGEGTSFATPQVAGVMALLRQQHPSWAPKEIYTQIVGSARGGDPDLDAAAAVGVSPTLGCASVGASVPAAHPGGSTATGGGGGTTGHSTAPPGGAAPVATATPAGGTTPGVPGSAKGGTLTPVTGATGSAGGQAATAASLPLAVGIPAAVLIVGAPATTAVLRRRARRRL